MDWGDWFPFLCVGFYLLFQLLREVGLKPFLPAPGTGEPGRHYWIYGLVVLAVFGASSYWGLGFLDSDKVQMVPKGVRENPGAYRAHYRSYGRTFGGK